MYIVIDSNFIQQIGAQAHVQDQDKSEYHLSISQIPGIIAPIDSTPLGLLMNLINTLVMPIGTRFPVIVFNLCPTYSGKFEGANEYYGSTSEMIHCVDMTLVNYQLTEAQSISHNFANNCKGFPMFPLTNLVKGTKSNSGNLYRLFDKIDVTRYTTSNVTNVVDIVKPTNEITMINLNFKDACNVEGIYALQFFPVKKASNVNGIEGNGVAIMFNSYTMKIELFSIWKYNGSLEVKSKRTFQRANRRKLEFYITCTLDNFCLSVVDPETQQAVFETVLTTDTYNRRTFIGNMSMEQTMTVTAIYNESSPMSSNITDMVYSSHRLFEMKNCANSEDVLDTYQLGMSELPHHMATTANHNTFNDNVFTVRTTVYSRNALQSSFPIPKAENAITNYSNLVLHSIENFENIEKH